jgi:hypothetical protein
MRGAVAGVNQANDMIGADAGLTLQVLHRDLGDAMHPFILDCLYLRVARPVIRGFGDLVRVYVVLDGH